MQGSSSVPMKQDKATESAMLQLDNIEEEKRGTSTEQQVENQISKDIVSDKKRQKDKIIENSLTASTLQSKDSEENQQDKSSNDGNTDFEDQEETQQEDSADKENNNRQNDKDDDDDNNNNKDITPMELPIPFP